MRVMKGFLVIALALGVTSGALGCKEKGAMEKAGEAVDEAVDDVEEAGRDAGRAVEDATD